MGQMGKISGDRGGGSELGSAGAAHGLSSGVDGALGCRMLLKEGRWWESSSPSRRWEKGAES